jgi:hypothetical protein
VELVVITAAQLMVVSDRTIANIARQAFSKARRLGGVLVRVVNSYVPTFREMLLMGGRFGTVASKTLQTNDFRFTAEAP